MRLFGEQCAIVAVVYSAFVAELRTGIANVTLALVDRSTPRLPGLQSRFETSVAWRYLRSQPRAGLSGGVLESAGKPFGPDGAHCALAVACSFEFRVK
jgi:hypothetical protein